MDFETFDSHCSHHHGASSSSSSSEEKQEHYGKCTDFVATRCCRKCARFCKICSAAQATCSKKGSALAAMRRSSSPKHELESKHAVGSSTPPKKHKRRHSNADKSKAGLFTRHQTGDAIMMKSGGLAGGRSTNVTMGNLFGGTLAACLGGADR